MTATNTTWYNIEDIDRLDSPALVIYPARVKANIQRLLQAVPNINRLRPHVKTHKSPEATRLLLEAGIQKFKCATIAEAEMLAKAGAADVLLAYPLVGPKIKRLIALMRRYPNTRFACLTDHPQAAAALAGEADHAGATLLVYIDLNTGMNRTGIAPGPAALELYQFCAKQNGLRVQGLHAYDGHMRHKDPAALKRACDAAFEGVQEMRTVIIQMGYPEPIIVAGGSPSFPVHAQRKYAECSPGTFIYWDQCYTDLCPEQPFEPAALVVTRVLSLPNETEVTTDLGHKSIAAENAMNQRVFFLNAPYLEAVRQSEEHLVLKAPAGHSLRPGDVLYGVPFHVCPTIALYDHATTVENGHTNGQWKIWARDRSIGC